jgi:hypothetical protein
LAKSENRDGIFKLLRSPRIGSQESIPPPYVALQASTTYSIPSPLDFSKILALESEGEEKEEEKAERKRAARFGKCCKRAARFGKCCKRAARFGKCCKRAARFGKCCKRAARFGKC